MEQRARRSFWRHALGRLLRETGGGQTFEWALGAAIGAAAALAVASGVQGSFGAMAHRIGASLGADDTVAADPGRDAERRRLGDEAERYRRMLEEAEAAKEAREEEADGGLFGSIFGGPLIGTEIGAEGAILEPSEPSFGGSDEEN